jgi:hypothetical protein
LRRTDQTCENSLRYLCRPLRAFRVDVGSDPLGGRSLFVDRGHLAGADAKASNAFSLRGQVAPFLGGFGSAFACHRSNECLGNP